MMFLHSHCCVLSYSSTNMHTSIHFFALTCKLEGAEAKPDSTEGILEDTGEEGMLWLSQSVMFLC